MVEFASNGRTAQGYLATPAEGTGPGVIVLQEGWGLVGHIKRIADRFAAEGFVALAPDLYAGKKTASPDEAAKLMMAMNIAETEKDLRGAVQHLMDHPRASGDRVGSVGFCMGGALSLYAATKNQQVGACVIFYGGHPTVKPDLANLSAPVLGLYAEQDTFATPEAARELGAKLAALRKQAEIHIYEGVDHAFFNDDRPEVYNRAAAEDAWRRTVTFFRAHLNTDKAPEIVTSLYGR